MPEERKLKYVPSKEDVAKVLLAAEPEVQDYLVAIMNTMARVGEINLSGDSPWVFPSPRTSRPITPPYQLVPDFERRAFGLTDDDGEKTRINERLDLIVRRYLFYPFERRLILGSWHLCP
jgi:hypothetical protein